MSEEKLYGWTGKILGIDLTKGKTSEVPTMKYAEKFIGGKGINARIHWEMVPPTVGAFDPKNVISVMTGPLVGTVAPASSRSEVGATSPQTYPKEVYTISSFGGYWGAELKYAGWDGVIIQGRADKPVWVYVHDDNVQIRDGRHLWGLFTSETQERIWEELGDATHGPRLARSRTHVLTMGPAGENLVRNAILFHGNSSGAGQGGFGAVWGSKNLKAIAVRGTGSVDVAKPEDYLEICRESARNLYRPEDRPETWKTVTSYHRTGWSFFHKLGIKGYNWLATYTQKAEACHACPIGCRINVASIPSAFGGRGGSAKCNEMAWYSGYDVKRHGKPTEVFWKAAKAADAYGVNAFEMIGLIPWLEKIVKAGIITEEELGLKMDDLGTYEFAEALLKMITYRQGIGDILAEGAPRVADIMGKGSQKYLEYTNQGFAKHWYPRVFTENAIFWAVSSRHPVSQLHSYGWLFNNMVRGNNPQSGWLEPDVVSGIAKAVFGTDKVIDHSEEGKYDPAHAKMAKWMEDYDVLAKRSMVLCCYGPWPQFASYYSDHPLHLVKTRTPDLEAKMFTACTGTDMLPDGKAMMDVGERLVNMERAIMVREGRTRKEDTLADFIFTKLKSKTVTGLDGKKIKVKTKLDREKFSQLMDEYYKLRGWDVATGRPTRKTLERVGLKDVADELDKSGLVPA